MLQRLLPYLLFMLVSSPVLLKTGLLTWYFWNKSEIAAKWCENRDQPRLHCDGKCYLTKQLKKVDQVPEAPVPNLPAKLWEKTEVSPFLPPVRGAFVVLAGGNAGTRKNVFPQLAVVPLAVVLPIFKPPG